MEGQGSRSVGEVCALLNAFVVFFNAFISPQQIRIML